MDYETLLVRVKKYIEKEVKPGTVFEVKSLFEGVEWEALEKGDKTGFGRYFSNAEKNGMIKGIARVERANNNHARYIKLEDDT